MLYLSSIGFCMVLNYSPFMCSWTARNWLFLDAIAPPPNHQVRGRLREPTHSRQMQAKCWIALDENVLNGLMKANHRLT